MSEGWIALHRKLQDNPLWTSEPFTRGQAWVDLILLANHEKGFFYCREHKINVERGQVGWSQNKLSKRWQWSRTKVRKFLSDLEEEQQIKQQKNKSYTIITLLNYDYYQHEKQEKNKSETREEQQKNINNNVNNDNNITARARKVMDFVNDLDQLQKLEKPLKPEQADKLVKKFGESIVKDVLMSMENYKGLTKKYTSVYLTANNWCKKRAKDNPPSKNFNNNRFANYIANG